MEKKHGGADSMVKSVLKSGVDNHVVKSVLDSQSYGSVVKSVLRCRVCNNMYSNPVLAPCLHTFCKACIAGFKPNNGVVKCPVCDMVLVLPAGEEERLPTNVFVARFTEMFPNKHVTKPCTVCALSGGTDVSVFQCIDCLDFLCQKCAKGHLSSTSTVTHRVVSRNVLLSGKYDVNILEKQTAICYQHNEDVEMYCRSCRDLVCIMCALAHHGSHDTVLISEAANSAKQNLQTVIRESIMCLSVLKTKSDSLSSILKAWKKLEKQKIGEVSKQIDHIISKIKKEGEQIVKHVQDFSAKQKHEYAVISGAIESLMTSGKDVISLCGHVIARGSDVDMILLHDTLEGRLKTADDVDKEVQIPTQDLAFNLKVQEGNPTGKYFILTNTSASEIRDDQLPTKEIPSKNNQDSDSYAMPIPTVKQLSKMVKDEVISEKKLDFDSLKLRHVQLNQSYDETDDKMTFAHKDLYPVSLSEGREEKKTLWEYFKDQSTDMFLCMVLLMWLYLATHLDVFASDTSLCLYDVCVCLGVSFGLGGWFYANCSFRLTLKRKAASVKSVLTELFNIRE